MLSSDAPNSRSGAVCAPRYPAVNVDCGWRCGPLRVTTLSGTGRPVSEM